eukprot:TRINITY_DN7498_c0_g5_i1.p1 TRINITY_DN7498_c0_g5~~TRINITY_DN7498_c0_g5_i1.p1  ORF type:complete len:387 (+),score=84.65 TRINITY_DN7498_c0_g5_i1:116-1162(+)
MDGLEPTAGPTIVGLVRSRLAEHRFATGDEDLGLASPSAGAERVTLDRPRPGSAPLYRPGSAASSRGGATVASAGGSRGVMSMSNGWTSADLLPGQVDLYTWKRNKEFTGFLYGSAWQGRAVPRGESPSHGPARQAVQAAKPMKGGTVRRLLQYREKKMNLQRQEVGKDRVQRRAEDARRKEVRELLRCVQYNRNRASKGRAVISGCEPGVTDAPLILLAGVAACRALATRAATAAVLGKVTIAAAAVVLSAALACDDDGDEPAPHHIPTSPPRCASDVVRHKLLSARTWSHDRRYCFRPMTMNAIKPRPRPPPHPVAREPRAALGRGTPMFCIGPVAVGARRCAPAQ